MTPASRYIYAVSFVLVAGGFLTPWWPLSVFGVALAALSGRWLFGLLAGVILDLAYGAPTTTAQFLFFPFGLFALLLALVRVVANRFLFSRGFREKI